MRAKPRPARAGAAVALTVAGMTALAACGGSSSGATPQATTKTVSVVGFSVLQTANTKVFKDFQSTPAGKGVQFTTSYGASGDQSRAVAAGLNADEVHLSLEPDVTSLVQAGVVPQSWNSGWNHGVLTQSVVVLVVRKGNPKHITGWDDLVKPGVKIVTPNPGSSGSAKWNILAAYGHVLAEGGSPTQAKAYLKKFFEHTVTMPGSGSEAASAFESGTGDVLVSYEDEAIEARQAGANFDYLVPAQTLLIQNTGALTKQATPAAKAFMKFQLSKAGQTDYAEEGFRPLVSGVQVSVPGANDTTRPFPQPQTLMTINKDFGGWDAANTKFFDANTGIATQLMAATGMS